MTRPLHHLEGSDVHFLGTITEHRRKPGGELHLMLRNVEVRHLIHDAPLLAQKPVKLQHLWITVPAKNDSPITRQMLAVVAGIGTVTWYARADRTVDLGIRELPSVELGGLADRLCASLPRNPHPDMVATAMEAMLQFVEERLDRCWSNSDVFSRDQELAIFRRTVAVEVRNRQANQSRLAQSRAHCLARCAPRAKKAPALPFLP